MKILFTSIYSLFALLFFSSGAVAADVPAAGVSQVTAHSFSFTAIDGKPLPLSDYKGKVMMVVNTASNCGLTPQYEGLEKLYQTYKDKGFVVIGVPSNDFGGQEPEAEKEIAAFTQNTYNVTFPLTQKNVVTGDKAHPFYVWAAAQKAGGLTGSKPLWNFHKYLIDRSGNVVGGFASWTSPASESITALIEQKLAEE